MVMRYVGVILFFLIFTFRSVSIEPVLRINQQVLAENLEAVKDNLGAKKTVAIELESVFYTAIKYYPELKDTKIVVKSKNIKTTMQCRPRMDFIFRKAENRTYIIYVDNKKKGNDGVLYKDLPLDARVGVMGHELAHVIDYRSMKNAGIVKFGVDYLNATKRKAIENGIDELAIEKGLGYQINAFSEYIFEDSQASESYLRYKMKFYFRPKQIKKLIAQNPIYYNKEDVLNH